jgi:hypothetical protein
MSLTVNMWSWREGELKRFLESYYESEVSIADDNGWICEYARPVEAVDIISAVIDNNDKYQIVLCIQIDGGQLFHVTPDNMNETIKDIFLLFYNENQLCYS